MAADRSRSRSPTCHGYFSDKDVLDLATEYQKEGVIFPSQRLLSEDELDAAERLLAELVADSVLGRV